MEQGILNIGIGEPTKTLTVRDMRIDEVQFDDDRTSNKAVMICETADGRTIEISEAWVVDKKGNKKVQGLWINLDSKKKLAANSVLARFLTFHKVGTINELINKELTGYPDENDYTVFTTIDNPLEPAFTGGIPD